MKIAVIQASSQKDKNGILYESVRDAVQPLHHEVLNLGVYENDPMKYSYVDTAFCIAACLGSHVVDFVVSGCSSGQGMMLACNAFPSVLCGYCKDASDGYLFGRINGGNAVSLPLGLHYGWAGEINLKHTIQAVFDGSFGCGYPKEDAERKIADADRVKQFHEENKKSWAEVLNMVDFAILSRCVTRKPVMNCLMQYAATHEITKFLNHHRNLFDLK